MPFLLSYKEMRIQADSPLKSMGRPSNSKTAQGSLRPHSRLASGLSTPPGANPHTGKLWSGRDLRQP